MRRLRQLLAGLLAVALLVSGSADATVAQETVGIRILDAPTNRADDPRARSYIVDHLAPGTTINRRVEVSNDTTQARHIELYAAAAEIADGTFQFGEGRAANDLTRWTTVAPSSLDLAPTEKGVATVTIAVPDDATAGEQYGVVWAEMSDPASESQGIGAVNRVGVRMYVSVGPGGEPPTDFEITEIQGRRDEDRNPVVAATVRNTGGRALDLTGELQLTDGPGGLSAGPFSALGTTLKSGQSAPVLFTLDAAVPSGPWQGQVSMRSGTTERDAAGPVTFPDEAGGAGPSTKPDSGLSDWALRGISGSITTALLLFFLLFLRRRRKKKDDADEDEDEDDHP